MSVALRTITRLQDADDINVSLGAGVDEYALCWDNDTAKFVLRAPFAGLLATGATTGATSQAQAFTNGIVGPSWRPSANSTTALQLQNAAGTSVLNVDTTNARVGIGTTSPAFKLHVNDTRALFTSPSVGGDIFFEVCNNPNYSEGTYILVGVSTSGDLTGFGMPGSYMSVGANSGAAMPIIIHNYDNKAIVFSNANLERMRIHEGGNVGIGTSAPATILHAVSTTATTNAIRDVFTLGANVTSTGVGAAGLGAAVLFQAESSTTVDTSQAQIAASWIVATHATRTARLTLSAYDTAAREGIRIDANGTAATIGFLGASAIARIAHVADPTGGGTVDAEARSAINAILSTLEGFGFHATS